MPHCGLCSHNFDSQLALNAHRQNKGGHLFCRTCNEDFTSLETLVHHWAVSPRHCCQKCDKPFDDGEDLEDHYLEEHNTFYCWHCHKFLKNQSKLDIHDAEYHYYCILCKRYLASQTALDTHLQSSIHKLPKRYDCPGRKCGKCFGSVGAITQHLESGCCSKANRAVINRFVAQIDSSGIITDPARLIRGPGASPETVTQTWATGLSWNGHGFECYICHSAFIKLDRLNQHLSSGTHDAEVYRCPKGYGGCNAHFKMLSALCQHVESERCTVHKFKKDIEKLVEYGLTQGVKAIMA